MPLIDDFTIAFLVTNQPNIWYFVEVKAAVSVSWNFNELKTHFFNISVHSLGFTGVFACFRFL